jgi:anaerobic magnesium-protoporphyrin IX monomethyl ester cyclase
LGADPAKVRGLAFYQNGKVEVTPDRRYIQDLDSIPAAWDLLEWPIYTYKAKNDAPLAIVSSSRGCIQQCSFCSQQLLWSKRWRGRNPENFVRELEMLRDNYGIEVAMLSDEIPTFDRGRWERILDLMIQRETGVRLLLETRVDDILRDEDIMDKYNRAGVEHIYVGVEAGTQDTLDIFKKNTQVDQSKKAIDIINNADIVSETSFVLGMPDDTPESIARTVELAKHYAPDMGFFLAIAPWPYSDIYAQLKEHVVETDYSKYNLVTPVLKPRNMTLEELNKELILASKKFFMDKFQNLHKLSSWKQEFMLSVFDILMNNSYLAEHMKSLAGAGKKMPPEVAAMLKNMNGMKRSKEKEKVKERALAPIP